MPIRLKHIEEILKMDTHKKVMKFILLSKKIALIFFSSAPRCEELGTKKQTHYMNEIRKTQEYICIYFFKEYVYFLFIFFIIYIHFF